MSDSPVQRFIEALRRMGRTVKPTGPDRFMAQCPAHDDANPSLSIGTGDGGRALVHCHAGCTAAAVVAAASLTVADLMPDGGDRGGHRRTGRGHGRQRTVRDGSTAATPQRATADGRTGYDDAAAVVRSLAARHGGTVAGEWTYHGGDGLPVLTVVRLDRPDGRKEYRPIHPTDNGWIVGDPPGVLPLYRLPSVTGSDGPVYVVEGEKAADAAVSIGLNATTSAHGAKAASKTDWRQLAGRDVMIMPDNDEPGREYARWVARHLLDLDATTNLRVVRLPGLPDGGDVVDYLDARDSKEPEALRESIEELADKARVLTAADVSQRVKLTCLADIEARPVAWLWPGRIALGKVTMLAGDPGLGKSFVTLDIAARVSRGVVWPDGTPAMTEPAGVILLTAEDDPADTIRPRLDAAGADVSRIHALEAVRQIDGGETTFSIRHDMDKLDKLLADSPSVRLVIIDPITAYLDGVDSHKNADVRAVLTPLGKMAGAHNVAMLVVSHLNKSGSSNAQYRVSGSLAFTAAARAVWLFAKDKSDAKRRLMLPMKNNLSNDETGMAYQLGGTADGMPTVQWEREPVTVSADDVLADGDGESGATERDNAAEWLRDLLADGPVSSTDVFNQGNENGFTRPTLNRAKAMLKIRPHRHGYGGDGRWYWSLPDQTCSAAAKDAHVSAVSTNATGEHL